MKKGFTLIELLAVIVILAIIALIATPTILGVVENARKGSAESSALGYIDAVEKQVMINELDGNDATNILDNVYEISDLDAKKVTVKGQKPSDGWVQIEKGQVVNYSFKIGNYYVNPSENNSRVVANKNGSLKTKPEGVSSSVPTIDSCLGCVYAFTTDTWYYSGTPTTLTASQYKENYEDVVSESGKNYFLGMKLNASGTIEKAYACGIKDGETFCLEGSTDGSTYNANKTLLQSERLYNNGCDDDGSRVRCLGYVSVYADAYDDGHVSVLDGNGNCYVYSDGKLLCRKF